jgi:hypothetical protein
VRNSQPVLLVLTALYALLLQTWHRVAMLPRYQLLLVAACGATSGLRTTLLHTSARS